MVCNFFIFERRKLETLLNIKIIGNEKKVGEVGQKDEKTKRMRTWGLRTWEK